MTRTAYDVAQLHELLYQALETELGGIRIYQVAITCAVNEDLRDEWTKYLEETRTHRQVLMELFTELGLDPHAATPGREVVEHIGDSLVAAIKLAQSGDSPEAAQLVACECVVLAETKDHMNWLLIGHLAKHGVGRETTLLRAAYDAVEQEEDHHYYHTTGWTRELWIESLGLPAAVPPPEEVKRVETAIGAARAQQERDNMLRVRV